ncbi:hypothetical protein [Massilia sp. Leaf139]|uniref:hypothetical protein n=1 Tax=Massilia sp. Leaf139 TaxID=1736272 RepID=UPI0006FEFB01|nr:hypothetical protein [Massilia sp. Leaf139]KQQ89270.1 hypothetical protein ASF77_11550 [Massilia sp. Leaf139]
MNIAKHMEAVFVVALAAAASASFLSGPLPQAQAKARPAAILDSSIATETKMAVVVVKGKRPAAEQPTVLAARGTGSRI